MGANFISPKTGNLVKYPEVKRKKLSTWEGSKLWRLERQIDSIQQTCKTTGKKSRLLKISQHARIAMALIRAVIHHKKGIKFDGITRI